MNDSHAIFPPSPPFSAAQQSHQRAFYVKRRTVPWQCHEARRKLVSKLAFFSCLRCHGSQDSQQVVFIANYAERAFVRLWRRKRKQFPIRDFSNVAATRRNSSGAIISAACNQQSAAKGGRSRKNRRDKITSDCSSSRVRIRTSLVCELCDSQKPEQSGSTKILNPIGVYDSRGLRRHSKTRAAAFGT